MLLFAFAVFGGVSGVEANNVLWPALVGVSPFALTYFGLSVWLRRGTQPKTLVYLAGGAFVAPVLAYVCWSIAEALGVLTIPSTLSDPIFAIWRFLEAGVAGGLVMLLDRQAAIPARVPT
jgi:hypothetical protein